MHFTNTQGQRFATQRVTDHYGSDGWIAGQLIEDGERLAFSHPQFFADQPDRDSQAAAENYVASLSRHEHGTCACGNPADEYTHGECRACQQARLDATPTSADALAEMFRRCVE